MSSPRGTTWRRRLSVYLLAGSMAMLLLQHLHQQPVSMLLRYDYGTKRADLVGVSVRYLQREEAVAHVRFSYANRPAPREQAHEVKLVPGDYQVEVELHYRESPQRTVRRPLPVRAAARATIFL